MKQSVFILLLFFASLHADMFSKGNVGAGIVIGAASVDINNETKNYTLLGANVDYFMIDNLSVGVGYTQWFSNSPDISQLTIPLTYYFPIDDTFRPYAGAFYRHTFMGKPYDDYNSFGARGGVAVEISKNAYIGAGLVQEYYDNCSNFKECSSTYSEVIVVFIF